MRSVRLAVALFATVALPLASCATGNSYSKARTALERAADAYDRVRGSADGMIDEMPEPAASRARVALTIADATMLAARRRGTPAEQEQALRRLAGDVAGIVAAIARR